MELAGRNDILYYSSPEEIGRVIDLSPELFGFTTLDELNSYIILLLSESVSVINTYASDYRPTDERTELVNGVALEYVTNKLKYILQVLRPASFQTVDEKATNERTPEFFNKDMKNRLDQLVGSNFLFLNVFKQNE